MADDERVEILVDFRGLRTGQTVDLRNLSNKNNIDFPDTDKILRFEVVADSGPASTITAIPTTLDAGPQPNAAEGGISTMGLTPAMAVARRQLRFGRQHGVWMVNGVTWEDVEASGLTLLFANPREFSVEEWTLVNESGGWFHPAHIHLVNGKIVGRNTNGGKPFAWELGPKDVFYLGENESVTVLMQFGIQRCGQGKYMIHCRNLVHEDSDMMVQFSSGAPDVNDPVRADPPVLDTTPVGSFPPVTDQGSPRDLTCDRPPGSEPCCCWPPWPAAPPGPSPAQSPRPRPPPGPVRSARPRAAPTWGTDGRG